MNRTDEVRVGQLRSTVADDGIATGSIVTDVSFSGVIPTSHFKGRQEPFLPSRPREFHPEPLTDPDLILSHHPARAID
jgi:hypothetical protein